MSEKDSPVSSFAPLGDGPTKLQYGVNLDHIWLLRQGKEKPISLEMMTKCPSQPRRGALYPRAKLGYLNEMGRGRGAHELDFETD